MLLFFIATLTREQSLEEHLSDALEIVEELREDSISDMEVSVDQIKHLKDLLENMKTKFHDKNTTRHEKMQILTLLPSNWQYNDIKQHFEVSEYMINLSRKLQRERGLMSTQSANTGFSQFSQHKST